MNASREQDALQIFAENTSEQTVKGEYLIPILSPKRETENRVMRWKKSSIPDWIS